MLSQKLRHRHRPNEREARRRFVGTREFATCDDTTRWKVELSADYIGLESRREMSKTSFRASWERRLGATPKRRTGDLPALSEQVIPVGRFLITID